MRTIKTMSSISVDNFEEDLSLGDLTDNKFGHEKEVWDDVDVLSSTPTNTADLCDSPKRFKEDLSLTAINPLDLSASPKGLGEDKDDLSQTMINPVELPASPQGIGSSPVKKKVDKPSSLVRKVYLITYSQADVLKVSDRNKFGELVAAEFNREDQVVENWVVSAELHRRSGFHYHLAIKLNKQRRFKQVRNNLKKLHGIDVDFHEWHDNYYQAYTYVTKFDSHYVTSPNHPVLSNPPGTTQATGAKRARKQDSNINNTTTNAKKNYKPARLTSENVGNIIRDNNITTQRQLYAFAKIQATEGKNDLQSYLYKHPNSKQHSDLVATVWNIEKAGSLIQRENKSRLEILREAKVKPCDNDAVTGAGCNGLWLLSALETLRNNNINRKDFSEMVMENLVHGRGKGRNIMICGPTNCAKSFILLPLTKIYKCFMTPSHGSYNWVEAPQKEVIFLNDIRYDNNGEHRVMPWNMFLNLLEGVTVNISMPKNFYSKDFEWTERQPIFATSDRPIVRIRNGCIDEGETQQMAQRWKIVNFRHQYLGDKVNYNLTSCSSCFAKLILNEH